MVKKTVMRPKRRDGGRVCEVKSKQRKPRKRMREHVLDAWVEIVLEIHALRRPVESGRADSRLPVGGRRRWPTPMRRWTWARWQDTAGSCPTWDSCHERLNRAAFRRRQHLNSSPVRRER